MLSTRERIMLNYFRRKDQVVTLDALWQRFRRSGDEAMIRSVVVSLEEHALIDAVVPNEAWSLSDYGRLICQQPIEQLQKI